MPWTGPFFHVAGSSTVATSLSRSRTFEQRQPVAGRNGPIAEGFERRDLRLQGGGTAAERGVVEGQVLSVVRTLELKIVDIAPLREMRRQVVFGADAGIRRDPVQVARERGIARLRLEHADVKVPRERKV